MDIRAKILSMDDRKTEVVHVPEWGVDIHVYSMTARDKTALQKHILKYEELPDDYFARIVYMCACDESGTRIFTEKDIAELQDKSATAVSRIAEVAMSLSKMNESPEALAEKNSETNQDGSPSTD
jgi:hypothetical protein